MLGYDRDVPSIITGLESFNKVIEKAEPGDQLGILLRGLNSKYVRRGCVLIRTEMDNAITDKARAQLYVLKPEEGGLKFPIASYYEERVYSLTWDCESVVKIMDKDFIMPGEYGE